MAASSYDTICSIQLETTSRCNLACVTCLKPAYQQSWLERDMEQSLFDRILSQIKEDKPAVHLQGWGEPLIQDGFISFLQQLARAGIASSFTTNGTIMTEKLAESLVDSGVGGITFSMAGACSKTQDRLRGQGSFALLKKSIALFIKVKRGFSTKKPYVAVSYLLTPETVKELPKAVAWCRKVGVDSFVTVFLTQTAGQAQKHVEFLPSKQSAKRFRLLRMLTNLHAVCGSMKLNMRPFFPTITPVCDKNPVNSLFISANGDVSPCVFLAPPVKNGIMWQRGGSDFCQQALVMGNANSLTLKEIWQSDKYRIFRETFRQRVEYHDMRLAKVSYSLSGSTELESAVRDVQQYFDSHPVPSHCYACAKVNGY